MEIDIAPLLAAAKLLYGGAWVAERTAALGPLLRSNPNAVHPVVRAIVEGGKAFSAVDAFNDSYALKAYERAAESMWARIDTLVLPTAATRRARMKSTLATGTRSSCVPCTISTRARMSASRGASALVISNRWLPPPAVICGCRALRRDAPTAMSSPTKNA